MSAFDRIRDRAEKAAGAFIIGAGLFVAIINAPAFLGPLLELAP